MASPNATVLPEPVWAETSRSRSLGLEDSRRWASARHIPARRGRDRGRDEFRQKPWLPASGRPVRAGAPNPGVQRWAGRRGAGFWPGAPLTSSRIRPEGGSIPHTTVGRVRRRVVSTEERPRSRPERSSRLSTPSSSLSRAFAEGVLVLLRLGRAADAAGRGDRGRARDARFGLLLDCCSSRDNALLLLDGGGRGPCAGRRPFRQDGGRRGGWSSWVGLQLRCDRRTQAGRLRFRKRSGPGVPGAGARCHSCGVRELNRSSLVHPGATVAENGISWVPTFADDGGSGRTTAPEAASARPSRSSRRRADAARHYRGRRAGLRTGGGAGGGSSANSADLSANGLPWSIEELIASASNVQSA